MMDLSRAEWRKSTQSGSDGCVEVAFIDGGVAVRDSKDRGGPVLMFDANQWASFLSRVRDQGEFQLPG